MADVKISQLPAATTPLTGAELVPVVQNGTTKKTTTSDVLAVPITSLTASSAVATDADKKLVSVANTGTGDNVLSTSPTLVTPALGTPSALVGTNITGTAAGLTAGNVTTNANLTGAVTSVGNATSLGSFSSANLAGALTDETGSGSAVFATSPTLVTPILGTPQSVTLTNGTGLPISTGVSGLGTGVATALGVNVGTAGSPVVNGGALGTPSSGTVTNLTGTANITVTGGASGAIAATTLSASSTVTLSGGTANGVAYLDGSKVLTTGAALTFDGSTFVANSNATISNTSAVLRINGTSGNPQVLFQLAGSNSSQLTDLGASGLLLQTISSYPLVFGVNAIEQMRLTSTGLGIGTTSPNKLLSIAALTPEFQFQSTSTAIASGASFGAATWYSNDASASSTGVLAQIDAVANRNFDGDQGATGMDMRFLTAPLSSKNSPIERMRIDFAGNVGIGTSSPGAKLDVAGAIRLTGNVSTKFGDANEGIINGTQFYPASAGLTSFGAVFGDSNASSGITLYGQNHPTKPSVVEINTVSGNKITYSASGNLGLGVTPSAWASIIKPLEFANGVYIGGQTDVTPAAFIGTNNYYDGVNWVYKKSGYSALRYLQDGSSGSYQWGTAPSGTAGAVVPFTQAMTLDASGNLLVGATSASLPASGRGNITVNGSSSSIYSLSIAGAQAGYLFADTVSFRLAAPSSNYLAFDVGSERARIDSSGNLLVGTTSSGGSLTNTARAVVGISSTHNGTTSAPTATAVTIFTAPTNNGAAYLLTATITGPDVPSNYTCVGILRTSATGQNPNYTSLAGATNASVTLSGTSVQYTQTSGVTQTANWSILKIV